jgi:hypothetical protein
MLFPEEERNPFHLENTCGHEGKLRRDALYYGQ